STPTLCRTSSILFFSLPCSSLFSLFFFSSSPAHPALHSFPTRRSSDLLLSDPDCQLVGARGIAMQAQGFKRDRHLSTVIKENFSSQDEEADLLHHLVTLGDKGAARGPRHEGPVRAISPVSTRLPAKAPG